MARIRSVHPTLWTDSAFVSVSPHARLLYIGLWGEADDGGAFRWDPVQLKLRLLGMDSVNANDLLAELVSERMIRPYVVDDIQYGAIRNFGRFQHPKFPKRTLPMPDDLRKYAASAELITVAEGVEQKDFRIPTPKPLQMERRGEELTPPYPPAARRGKRYRNGFLAVIEAEGMPSQDPVAAFAQKVKSVGKD